MARRALLTAVVALLLTAPAAAAQPNVVVLMTDDQTAASLPSMPRVNGLLGAGGTRFEQAFASFPLCCPSRTTHLTGQYAHNHGVLHNAGPFGGYSVFDHAVSLPAWLQRAGYRTMHVGRYLNGYTASSGVPTGLDRLARDAPRERLQLPLLEGERERRPARLSHARPAGRVPDRLPGPARERADPERRLGRRPVLPVAVVHGAPPGPAAGPGRSEADRNPVPGAAAP